MLELIVDILQENCLKFSDCLTRICDGTLENDLKFKWISLFIGTGYKDIVIELLKLSNVFGEADIKMVDEISENYKLNSIRPTCCRTFGCSDEEINKCQNLLTFNSNHEANNSPSFFISAEKIKSAQLKLRFEELKEKVILQILDGDKSAHLEEEFIKVVAQMKNDSPVLFEKLKTDLQGNNVKIQAFVEEVNKFAKTISKGSELLCTANNVTLPEILKPFADGLDPSKVFIDDMGQLIVVINSMDSEILMPISNFVARIVQVLEYDECHDFLKEFVIEGILEGTKQLHTITVSAKEFSAMNWVLTKWGNVIITSAPKAKEFLREAIQKVSINAPVTNVYYSLGWKEIDGNWCYLYSSGVIGNNTALVAEITELKGYYFTDYNYDVKDCARFVQLFMDIAPHEITFPLLAHTFLSILIEKLKMEDIEPRYLLWVYGVSGSFKTALSVVLMNFFGKFRTPPASFNDTITALEKKSFLTKDSMLLVDDYCPAASPQEARAKVTVANVLTRKYGDRISKGRSKSNLQLAKEYPPRGNLICTSEDLLVGHSTNSRHIGVSINRGDIDPNILTELQNNTDLLTCFMYNFIEYVSEKIMNTDHVSFKEKFLEYRDNSQDSNHHKRFAESIACMQIGFEVLLDFLRYIDFIDDEKHKAHFDEAFRVFKALAKQQNALVQHDDIADKYMSALKELIDTKQIEPVNKNLPTTLQKGTVLCYEDENNYYFIPQSTYAVVCEFFSRRGELLSTTELMLRKMLEAKKYIITLPDDDNRKTVKIRIGLKTIWTLQVPKSILDTF